MLTFCDQTHQAASAKDSGELKLLKAQVGFATLNNADDRVQKIKQQFENDESKAGKVEDMPDALKQAYTDLVKLIQPKLTQIQERLQLQLWYNSKRKQLKTRPITKELKNAINPKDSDELKDSEELKQLKEQVGFGIGDDAINLNTIETFLNKAGLVDDMSKELKQAYKDLVGLVVQRLKTEDQKKILQTLVKSMFDKQEKLDKAQPLAFRTKQEQFRSKNNRNVLLKEIKNSFKLHAIKTDEEMKDHIRARFQFFGGHRVFNDDEVPKLLADVKTFNEDADSESSEGCDYESDDS